MAGLRRRVYELEQKLSEMRELWDGLEVRVRVLEDLPERIHEYQNPHPEFHTGDVVAYSSDLRWVKIGQMRTVRLVRNLGYGWRVVDEADERYFDAMNSQLFAIENPVEPRFVSDASLPKVGDSILICTRQGTNLAKYSTQSSTILETDGASIVCRVGDETIRLHPGEYIVTPSENAV